MNKNENRLLGLEDVLEIIPVSKATWYRLIREGLAPKPVKVSLRRSVWHESKIREFVNGLV